MTVEALEAFQKNRWHGDLERHRAEYLAGRVRAAIQQIDAAASEAFFAGLPAGEMTETVAQVYAGHSQYGRFARAAARLLDPGLCAGGGGDLAASLRRSFDLFELYCLYKLTADLQHGLSPGWTSQHSLHRRALLSAPESGPFWIATGPAGERRVVSYQRTFSITGHEAIAASAQRRPDFVLADYLPDGTLKGWLLLDAKYRTSKDSIHEALKDMHVYRDSLRLRCQVTGRPVPCEAGYLLVPSVATACQEYAESAYRGRWKFGLLAIDEDLLAALV